MRLFPPCGHRHLQGARAEEKGGGNRVIHINNICKWSSGEGGGATSLLFFLIKLSNLGATLSDLKYLMKIKKFNGKSARDKNAIAVPAELFVLRSVMQSGGLQENNSHF